MDIKNKGLYIHLFPTQKYKTITFSLKFTSLLDKETAYKRTMISFLLAAATNRFPNSYELSKALDYLYGAVFSTSSGSKGQSHILHTYMEVIDPLLVNDPHLIDHVLEIYSEIIFHPCQEQEGYSEKIFNQCLEEYYLRFQEDKDDKTNYAIEKLFEYMGEGTTLGIESYGKEEQLQLLDRKDLLEYYYTLLKEDRKDFYVVGNIDNSIIDKINEYFPFEDVNIDYPSCMIFQTNKDKVLYKKEKQANALTRILMGFCVESMFTSPYHEATIIMNGILGQYSHSLLFKIIREQYGLCYSINSTYDSFNGVISIYAAVEKENIDKVLKLINECIVKIQNGDFDEQLIDLTKKTLSNNANEGLDDPLMQIATAFNKDLCHLDRKYQNVTKINEVSKTQVIEIARLMKLDTVYILAGDGDE